MPATARRTFLKTSLLAGFALAVKPVAASTIQTDTAGLQAGPVQIGDLPAYRAQPAHAVSPLPTIIVIQEIFGVHEHIQDLCRRLAKQGYLAIAPELYFRQGDPRQFSDTSTLVKELVSKVADEQVLADLDSVAAWAGQHGGNPQRLAVTGFCWGGRITWLYAAHNPKIKASAAWYGRLTGQTSSSTPRHPIDIARQIKSPVLGLYAGKDQGISLESVEQMRKALRPQPQPFNLVVYDNASHGFNADYRPSYHPAAAHDAWETMLNWFKRFGV
ncbi:dienelactone hydrolase family protein [Janthinobacterium sp. B9-8]|uniref:dienelactone hydrolase family protein n=1 Tax=Janthinobacterium sp. B9-8 TaxID=1236179 RepID=UPI00061D2709|nr:dienelactone hydrolase family protein [Janthinobacterium sp. B9-8]AMC34607.1 carboxymethylenebutenolidase [Janthinobacterium sp. B9-8]